MKTGKDKVEEIRLERADREKALALCREIRDSETATYTEKLEAVRLIQELQDKKKSWE